ncbi:MAG: DUF305 domain-containing protein [Nocardioidaceae bacterium]|nr:DUF305 domain-containing protein [Nocardioidaceae bacterium]
MKKPLGLIGLSAAMILTVASCSDTDTRSDGDQFNDADVAFAQDMIPHHRQAIEMAEIATERAQDPEVKVLADDIIASQDREIDTMTDWLEAWGEDVSSTSGEMDHGDIDHGDMDPGDMAGMMSEEDMNALEMVAGDEFDQLFLTMMIEHHQGAVEMSQTEQAEGESPDAIALAKTIESDQESEIDKMETLLAS